MSWLGPIARVATRAAVGNAKGRELANELEREEMKAVLALEARKRAEAREERRLQNDETARQDTLTLRRQEGEDRSKDRAERGLDRDEDRRVREQQFRETREARAAEERQRAADRAAQRDVTAARREEETPAQKRAARLRSAKGNAQAWAEGGRSAEAIAGALRRYYPDVSFGELRGISVDVVRAASRSASNGPLTANDLDAKYLGRSSPPAPGTSGAKPETGGSSLSAADRQRAASDPDFKRWLVGKGYKL